MGNRLHPLTEEILSYFDPELLIAMAQEWIRVPSPSGEEREIMEVAIKRLSGLDLKPRLLYRDQSRPNVIAELNGKFPGPTIVLNGHLDTVPAPTGGKYDPFGAILGDGKLFGLGALDMKGSCAAMTCVTYLFRQVVDQMRGRLQLQLVSGEESGHYYGTSFLIEEAEAGRLIKPDFVINGEYTGLRLLTAERGSFKFGIRFFGKSAHTATARVEGVNAIYYAAKAIITLERDLEDEDPLVGKGVISVNKVRGGEFLSVVPDQCEIIIDRRMTTSETHESVHNRIREELDALFFDVDGLKYELFRVNDANGNERYSPPCNTDRDTPVVQALRTAHLASGGDKPPWFNDWFGVTDARLFRYKSIPAVSYGPIGSGAHAPDEFVETESLFTQVKVYIDAILRLLIPEDEL